MRYAYAWKGPDRQLQRSEDSAYILNFTIVSSFPNRQHGQHRTDTGNHFCPKFVFSNRQREST